MVKFSASRYEYKSVHWVKANKNLYTKIKISFSLSFVSFHNTGISMFEDMSCPP